MKHNNSHHFLSGAQHAHFPEAHVPRRCHVTSILPFDHQDIDGPR